VVFSTADAAAESPRGEPIRVAVYDDGSEGFVEPVLKALEARPGVTVEQVKNDPLLGPAGNPDLPDYEPLATFAGEVAEDGAPRGVVPDTTAIAAGPYGKGRELCFGPHPERTAGCET
jgi:hypothetical protein